MHSVSKSIENMSAQLGYYLFLLSLLGFIMASFPTFGLSPLYPAAAGVISLSLFVLSLSSFQWQMCSTKSKNKIIWSLFFLPFILYIPANVILASLGIVEVKLHDFGAYYNAAIRWLDGAPIYTATQEIPGLNAQISSNMPYLYPPIFVLIFVPFTIFPPFISGIIWDISALMFLIWASSRLISTFDVDITRRDRIILYLLIASFGPTITWLKAGQISGLLTGFLCLSGATLRSRQHRLSGIFTTLGSIIKPFYATSGAHLLRNRRRLLSAIGSGILLIGAGLLLFGVKSHIEYFEVLLEGKGWGTTINPGGWNAGHFNPFYILGPIKHLPRALIILATAGLALYSNTTETPIEYVFGLGAAVVPLAGPTANTLALNAVIPPLLMVGLYELEKTGNVSKILLTSSILIHIHPYTIEFLSKFGPQIYPPIKNLAVFIPLLQPALYGSVLLVCYLSYRLWENPVT